MQGVLLGQLVKVADDEERVCQRKEIVNCQVCSRNQRSTLRVVQCAVTLSMVCRAAVDSVRPYED